MGFMNVFITGYGGKKTTIQLPSNGKVSDLMAKIKEVYGEDNVRVISKTKEVRSDQGEKTLHEVGIEENSTVVMVVRAPGGGAADYLS